MMRRLLTAIAILILGTGAALAGDYAEREIIGFSPDGAYFAFEEFGIEDGSGFPYANIFVIATATDSWVAGTPIRVRIDNETATLDAARTQARQQASAILASLNIGEPGRLLVSNPITELGDGRNVDFLIRAYTPLQPDHWNVTIGERTVPSDCPDIGFTIVGLELRLASPTAVTTLVNDAAIPKSRGCPVGYGVSDIIAFDRPGDVVLVILLNMFTIGFEGPDRRFLAVATTIVE